MDFKSLVRTRASFKSKLNQFKSYLEIILSCNALSSLQVIELKLRLSKFEELYTNFDNTQIDIENLSEIPDDQYKEREDFENQYYAAVASAREVLTRNPSAGDNSSTSSVQGSEAVITGGPNLKLPTIHLPHFSGRYQDWLEFHDTFSSLIHTNVSIPKINKFHYLRAALKDSAAIVIGSLDFSAGNYEVAWQLLCDRFNNKRLLINNHIQAIFNIDSLTKESANTLRNVIDTVNKNLRALKTLHLPTDHWDVLIIHIVSSKLDSKTNREWEVHRNSFKDYPTLLDFNEFLKNRADLLETIAETHQGRKTYDTGLRHKAFVTGQSRPNPLRRSCFVCDSDHPVYLCQEFKSLPIELRIQRARSLKLCLNCLRKGHESKKCKLGPCKLCGKYHNTLLHIKDKAQSLSSSSITQPTEVVKDSGLQSSVVFTAAQRNTEAEERSIALSSTQYNCVLLSTALVNVRDRDGQYHKARVLLDSGSTSCFITNNLRCKLNLPVNSTSISVKGLSNQSSYISERCDVMISSLVQTHTEKIRNCLIVPTITELLPSTKVDCASLNIPSRLRLADPTYHTPSTVDLLLGAEIFWSILGTGQISLGRDKPVLNETKLGWLVSGALRTNLKNHSYATVHCNFSKENFNSELDKTLSRFFEIENISLNKSTKILSKIESQCEQHFIQNTSRQSDGRFVVTIPLKQSPECLGDSYQQALTRLLSLERRFSRDTSFKKTYLEFIQEYIQLGHMSENKEPKNDNHTYILPHHGVLRESSLTTKLRVVFDGSAVTSTNLSFNEIQMAGPTVQDDLISILLRFRQHKYVVTADIEKMYRQVLVNENQRSLQQILWRFNPSDKLKQYKLNTITYGTASAPYLATRCLVELGQNCTDQNVAESILHDFYVDDWISGHDCETQLIKTCKGVIDQLKTAQFHLRKFRSNNTQILDKIQGEYCNDKLFAINKDEYAKTLGLVWSCKNDYLTFSVNSNIAKQNLSKRTILSIISQIFDPLGLISPCILQAKLILQQLWASKVSWDEILSVKFHSDWSNFVHCLVDLNNIKIPRHVICQYPIRIELHAFSDASARAYCACVYIRSISSENTISVNLIVAKGRISPIDKVTVPRLELLGALLAARLANKVKSSLRLNLDDCYYWCDSTIVLGWIATCKSNLKAFVLNRVNEITDLTDSNSWQYVPTNYNPADIGSRGLNATQLKDSSLWWSGPPFLMLSKEHWPKHPMLGKEISLPETKGPCNISLIESISENNTFIDRFSNLTKLQRTTAFMQRFIHNCVNPKNKFSGHLHISELNSSINALCKIVQKEIFSKEYKTLQNNKQLSIKNKLSNLNPFIDKNGVMRVGGRLSNSNYTYDIKHPIVLHATHHLSKIIFEYYHKILMHGGPQLLLATVRHKYWIIGGRNLARKIVRNCITCCRFSGRSIQPIMGNLPHQRVHADYPFCNTSLDFAGPVMIANRKGRGCRLIKSYICVFVCLAVRAVHIELVTDLTKEMFLAAFDRFVARRGKPYTIFSDNGTNIVGGCNELAKFIKTNQFDISKYATEKSINFKFSPAYSPHFNGLAEGAVKSIKHHLKRILCNANLTYEEMNTVLIQIEAVLNSRPLTPLSSDPNDLVPLTPAHFLIGRTLDLLPSPEIRETSVSVSRYLRAQQLKAHFWSRYYKEYISELQLRQKWRKNGEDLQLGEMVLVKDDRLPPNRWLLGRVTCLYPGSDGITRVADVYTTMGTLRRAYNRLCPLPILKPEVSRGGAC